MLDSIALLLSTVLRLQRRKLATASSNRRAEGVRHRFITISIECDVIKHASLAANPPWQRHETPNQLPPSRKLGQYGHCGDCSDLNAGEKSEMPPRENSQGVSAIPFFFPVLLQRRHC